MDYILTAPNVDEQELIEQEEVRRFSRSLAGIEWLLAILVMLYMKTPGSFVLNELVVVVSLILFALFIIAFHYIWQAHARARWKLAIETWVMIGFITVVLWYTGKIESPLVSLYFLVIITAATLLGTKIALLEVALISACFLLLAFSPSSRLEFTLSEITSQLIRLFPFWLVAYLVAILSREAKLARRKIKLMSDTDYLTGLWNMRMFASLVKKELERSRRYNHSFTILMIDADNLKPVNDTHGHEMGSSMIKLLGSVIRKTLRGSDVVARFGGDEFVVMLPETKSTTGMVAAERIRRAVEATPLEKNGVSLQVTVSIGVSGFPEDGGDVDAVMAKADMAMYRSKRSGKNAVTLSAEEN